MPFAKLSECTWHGVSSAASGVAKYGTNAARSFPVDDCAEDSETWRTEACAWPTQEARHLIEAYQRLLEELLPAQEAIEADQERMAWGLAQAKQARPPDASLDMQV
eukprot:s17_g10.t1